MRRRRNVWTTVFVTAMVAGAMTLAGGPQAGASGTIDLTTKTGISNYLTSIGVNPASAVWQQSLLNYAGPSCPGVGWNCVGTNAPVVQLALPGGTNLFSCSGVKCLVIQTSPSSSQNSAECKRTGQDVTQSCAIVQVNSRSTNNANIEQTIVEAQGCDQTANEAASIDQTNGSGANHARIQQRITQSSKSSGNCGGTQDQEAHQGATVDQKADSGDNTSNIDQSQKQTETASGGSSITQNQNATTGIDFVSCDQPGETSDQVKNECAELNQNAPPFVGTGKNDSTLNQRISEQATASNTGDLTQVQGTFPGGESGDKGQHSSGVSTSHADQSMAQQVSHTNVTGTVIRSQNTGDPRCCQIQESNPNDQAFITQTTVQSSSPSGATQDAFLEGDCVSSGDCEVRQSATLDHASDTNSCSGPSCEFVILSCGSSDGEGGCGED
jgi:hypothetical protein